MLFVYSCILINHYDVTGNLNNQSNNATNLLVFNASNCQCEQKVTRTFGKNSLINTVQGLMSNSMHSINPSWCYHHINLTFT